MTEFDPLRKILREWEAPPPSAELDDRVHAAFRANARPFWRRVWHARISLPVPVLAAILLIAAVLALLSRTAPPSRPQPQDSRLATRLGSAELQPLPNGTARVVPIEEIKP
jgi:hypothetical protein